MKEGTNIPVVSLNQLVAKRGVGSFGVMVSVLLIENERRILLCKHNDETLGVKPGWHFPVYGVEGDTPMEVLRKGLNTVFDLTYTRENLSVRNVQKLSQYVKKVTGNKNSYIHIVAVVSIRQKLSIKKGHKDRVSFVDTPELFNEFCRSGGAGSSDEGAFMREIVATAAKFNTRNGSPFLLWKLTH